MVSSGFLSQGSYEYFSKEEQEQYWHKSSDFYCNGYVAIKVSLIDCRAKRVVAILANLLPALRKRSLVLHDIDFTRDCCYVTSRVVLEGHLQDNGIDRIVDDCKKVGDNCVSWWGSTDATKDIRYKWYNKFVQLLESAEVRKSLGSRMEDLVAKEGAFAKRLERHKDHGYSRIELTFYGPKLLSLEEYHDHMEETKKLLSNCTTYQCSFEMQWQERAKRIKLVVMVYFPAKKLFAYCHWWNSLTSLYVEESLCKNSTLAFGQLFLQRSSYPLS